MTEEKILRNLKDAGCDSDTIQKFFYLNEEGRQKEQLRLLAVHRANLLEQLHVSQSMIDCLDYLVYSLKKEQSNTPQQVAGHQTCCAAELRGI